MPLRCNVFNFAIRTRTCSGSRVGSSPSPTCSEETSGALPSACSSPLAMRFSGADVWWPVCCLLRRENGSTRKPSAITEATPTRGTSRASS
jgi:hypothetical protein